MKRVFSAILWFGAAALTAAPAPSASASQESQGPARQITIVQDNANIRFVSKVYQLKNVAAADLLPYLNSAIRRYNANSTIRRIIYTPGGAEGLLVTTGQEFMPCVDDLIKQLDIPAKGLAGTGISRVAYTPRYRAAMQFKEIINGFLGTTESEAGVNPATNTIFWRDNRKASLNTLAWVRRLDRPLPQARIRFNYYEIRESTLRDVGFDYLAWKNGPGVNLFNVGYNAGRVAINEAIEAATSWGYGGFFFAPAFDMSFIRCLQQSGEASVAANASLVVVNTPIATLQKFREICRKQKKNPDTAPYLYHVSMYPEYQNIAKNSLGRSFIGASYDTDETGELYKDPPLLNMTVINPVVCLPGKGVKTDAQGFPGTVGELEKADLNNNGGVVFRYSFNLKNVVERGNTGQELSNMTTVSGGTTLGFKTEKILAVYDKDSEVRQTIGLPVLSKIPILKYIFSTTTTVKESTYIIISAEAELVDPDKNGEDSMSRSGEVHQRTQKDFWED